MPCSRRRTELAATRAKCSSRSVMPIRWSISRTCGGMADTGGNRDGSLPSVGHTVTPASATRASRPGGGSAPPSLMHVKCSIPSTPASIATSAPATEWAWATTRSPAAWAAPTRRRSGATSNWAPSMSLPGVRKPPLAITFTRSTPRSTRSATARSTVRGVVRVDVTAEEPAVPERDRDRWTGSHHPRQPLALPSAVLQHAVAGVAEVADAGHPCRDLRPQAGRHHLVHRRRGGRAGPLEAPGRARERSRRDEVDVAVDQPGQEGAVDVGDGYVVRRAEGGGLDADDPVTLDEHRRAVRQEPRPVERAARPQRPPGAHLPMVLPGSRRPHRRGSLDQTTRPADMMAP